VLGVGNELLGDDGAGILVARGLSQIFAWSPEVLILEAGLAPENCTGQVRRFRPDWILLVDAANWGGKAGEILWADGQDPTGWSGSTHTLPLSMVAAFLSAELGCMVKIAGIQPACLDFGAPVSKEVEHAVEVLVEALAKELRHASQTK